MSERDRNKLLGEHRLTTETIEVPPEREAIAAIQENRRLSGWEPIVEAQRMGIMRHLTRHAELSPTFRCPEDCGGCPDRASLHLNDGQDVTITDQMWLAYADILAGEFGVEYFMLIGGTIDRRSVTPLLMKHILEMPSPADVGWFTDGIMLQNPHTGKPTLLLERLVKEGRMLELTTHVSADYWVPEGVSKEGQILDPSRRWENEYGGSRFYKSAYGERLARTLVRMEAKRIVINTAISAHNIDQVIQVYEYAKNLQDYTREIGSPTVVLHTFSPWVHRPHLARGDDPRNYAKASLLSPEHVGQLNEISQYIYQDTIDRLANGLPRVAGNSSGFILGLPKFAITQDITYSYGSSELAVQPNGTVQIDPIFVDPLMLNVAKNPYGYRDRDIDYNPFEKFDPNFVFPNLIQTTKGDHLWK